MNAKLIYIAMLALVSLAFAQSPNNQAAGAFGAITSLFFAIYCLAGIIALISIVVWLWALIDAIKRTDYDKDSDKLLWVVVVLLAGIIGAALYYFLVKRKKEANGKAQKEAKK